MTTSWQVCPAPQSELVTQSMPEKQPETGSFGSLQPGTSHRQAGCAAQSASVARLKHASGGGGSQLVEDTLHWSFSQTAVTGRGPQSVSTTYVQEGSHVGTHGSPCVGISSGQLGGLHGGEMSTTCQVWFGSQEAWTSVTQFPSPGYEQTTPGCGQKLPWAGVATGQSGGGGLQLTDGPVWAHFPAEQVNSMALPHSSSP
jgi:hypothetical protein